MKHTRSGLLKSLTLTAVILSSLPTSAWSQKSCSDQELRKLEDILSSDGGDAQRMMSIGQDASKLLKEAESLISATSCLERLKATDSQPTVVLENLRKYIESPFDDKFGIPAAECAPWKDSTILKFPARSAAYGFVEAHGLTLLLSNKLGVEIAPFELIARAANNPEPATENHLEYYKGDVFSTFLNVNDLIEGSKYSNRGLCKMSNFNLKSSDDAQAISDLINTVASYEDIESVQPILLQRLPLFHHVKQSDMDRILSPKRKLDRLQKLFEVACQERTREKLGIMTSIFHQAADTEMLETIGRILDQSINSNKIVVLENSMSGEGGSVFQIGIKARKLQGSYGDNISVVLGRRFHNNRCEYLVRDHSIGDCSKVSSTFQCDQSTSSVWMPRTTLIHSTLGVLTLQN